MSKALDYLLNLQGAIVHLEMRPFVLSVIPLKRGERKKKKGEVNFCSCCERFLVLIKNMYGDNATALFKAVELRITALLYT